MNIDIQLLTHSRQNEFKICRKRHWFSYEQRIRTVGEAKALRMGSAYHDALECLAHGGSLDEAVELVRLRYDFMPDNYEQLEWEYECETVVRLVCGYQWRWSESRIQHIAAEMEFQLPLINPDTGAATPIWNLAGKIDGIIRLEDSRLAVLEHKLLSEDLDDSSDLWRRMRIDHQISLYVLAARRLGHHVDAVLYNVCRKPTIKPTAVPVLDELGAKIVLNQFGDRVKTDRGLWRQTGDKEKQWELQTRPMTQEEWGNKLSDDIAARPEWYYQRKEIPRLDQDLDEYTSELWDIQRVIRDAQLKDRWYRTCNRDTCAFCPYFGPCSTGWQPTDALPEGFVRVENVHPELGEQNVNASTASDGSAETSTDPSDSAQPTGSAI